jgi:hypothetical protein
MAEELRRHGWAEDDLERRRKNDPDKLEIAARLRRETTLSVKEIAARVRLGTSKGANRNLHGYLKRGSPLEAARGLLGLSGKAGSEK